MKLVFAGTPEFAASSLAALLAAGHEVALVLTQPDRPAGRGLKSQPSAVKQLAQASGTSRAAAGRPGRRTLRPPSARPTPRRSSSPPTA